MYVTITGAVEAWRDSGETSILYKLSEDDTSEQLTDMQRHCSGSMSIDFGQTESLPFGDVGTASIIMILASGDIQLVFGGQNDDVRTIRALGSGTGTKARYVSTEEITAADGITITNPSATAAVTIDFVVIGDQA